MIIKIDETTLGKKQQVVSTTRLTIRCDECGVNEWQCAKSNHVQRKGDKDLCQPCKNKLGVSGMKGKHHSNETIKQYKNGDRAGDKNPSKRPEVRAKISASLKGVAKPCMVGRKRPEHAKKMSELMTLVWSGNGDYRQRLIDSQNKKHSKLHDLVKAWMEKNGVSGFETEQPIPNTLFIADELLIDKKIIIEINGDYWHCNPILFNKNDLVVRQGKTKKVGEIWGYDIMRKKELTKLGYRIFVIWEFEFKRNPYNLITSIKEFIND
jgi:very-short-patch-repair endonuclease